MITTIPFNEYTCGTLVDLLKKYDVTGHRIVSHIVSKNVAEEGEFVLSFEVCKVIFKEKEEASMLLLRLSSEEINKYIDKTTLDEMGFEYAKENN